MSDFLEYKGFLGSVEFSKDDNCLVGLVQFVPHSLAYMGDSVAEITQMFEASVDDYLAHCKETGVEPDKPFRGTFNVRIAPEQHRAVAIAALKAGQTLNSWISDAVSAKLASTSANHQDHRLTVKPEATPARKAAGIYQSDVAALGPAPANRRAPRIKSISG